MLREKETEIDRTLHPDSQSGLSKAQLEVLVLVQLDETGPLTPELLQLKKNHTHIRRLQKFLTPERPLLGARRDWNEGVSIGVPGLKAYSLYLLTCSWCYGDTVSQNKHLNISFLFKSVLILRLTRKNMIFCSEIKFFRITKRKWFFLRVSFFQPLSWPPKIIFEPGHQNSLSKW